ncbi:hypothetical protein HMPREF9069_00177 [Atopobium sp. oral taxon 810 str. F0209]|nr:hypothetical protein HMPREF9069_00177 [Atopobium sp. oral taxon 810 str. F0209]
MDVFGTKNKKQLLLGPKKSQLSNAIFCLVCSLLSMSTYKTTVQEGYF